MKTKLKKVIVLMVVLMLSSGFVSLSFANQDNNHGKKVSEVAKSTEPGPEHGKTVSEAARNKSTNYALSFDGIDDIVYFAPGTQLIPPASDRITVEARIKQGANIGWSHIIVEASPLPGSEYFWLGFDGNNRLWFSIMPTGAVDGRGIDGYVTEELDLSDSFHDIAAVWEAENSFRIFLDGEEKPVKIRIVNGGVNGLAFDYSIGDIGMGIGGRPTGSYFYNGLIDEIRVWNKSLTQSEIKKNMYKEIKPQGGLVGYWKFDEGSGDITYDSSNNGNHGVVKGDPQWVRVRY